ncbi:cysteine-rich receptor-like protein kinase 2 isoform X2 [Bidens hawaiensis]|uniref:cysteine-rich receptor-like protein kinase 2 isoform X2 n=2 Tax=Bidens hawaiensis TaxID=980011 RepID=UPI0040490C1D
MIQISRSLLRMKRSTEIASAVLMNIIIILVLVDISEGVPRNQIINLSCNNQTEHNQTAFVANFIQTTEMLGNKVRSSIFATASTGAAPDANYGLVQCYGDLSTTDCILCYDSAHFVISRCFPSTGGIVYQDGCFMRFQNYSFYEEITGPSDTTICGNTTRKSSVFQDSARQAVSNAVRDALTSGGYFAREEVTRPRTVNESAYVLANCWKTLSANACRACLEAASEAVLGCLPWSEGRALMTGCFMRYSDTDFLNPVPVRSKNRGKMIAVIASVVSAIVILVVTLLIALYIRRRRWLQQKRTDSYDAKKLVKILTDSSLNFKYSTIEKATSSWNDSNKLGQGGFGTVYKGVLPDGREIAVKRLFFNNKFRAADFYNEVNIVSSFEHKNLVRLLGCSCSGPESFLVYEYLPNMSLDRFIFDAIKGKELNWEKRFVIILGTTEGLVYLHENNKTCIIHRDIKAANILLDSRLRAKIADFGLARSFQEDKSHISTAVAGTLGHMAPEYLALGQLTEKADVYSYGVLLLEVVTGIQNSGSKNSEYTDSLVAIAWRHFQLGTVEEILDPNLMFHTYPNHNFKKEAIKVVHVGLLCTQEDPTLRPTISMALKMLVKDDEPLPPPSSPPFINDDDIKQLEENIQRYNDNDADFDSVATVSHSQFSPR